jgi:hypothetical protein
MKLARASELGITVVAALCLLAGYRVLLWPGRLKQESVQGAKHFSAQEDLYNKLLDGWTTIEPKKCGKPTAKLGFFESITREHDGSLTLARSDASYSKLSMDELAKLLDAKPEVVRFAVDALSAAESPEIIQSGPAVKIISRESDTRGYLHVDQSCSYAAATYAFWSEQPGNFTAEHPGQYVGLKSLGGGWYYYIEQR